MSRARQIRLRRVQRNRRIAAIMGILMFSVCVSIVFHNFHVQAEKPETFKYYTEVRVDRGDTLWDIAMEYMTEEYRSVSEYIREVKEINNLGVELQYGQFLTVPYYSDIRK